MKWIDSTKLRQWANRRDSEENVPLLVRKLIRVTCSGIKDIKFPAGDSIQFGGWDGVLEVDGEGTEYVPVGISLWEFGTNRAIRAKANDDYEKRKGNTLGYNPKECTFIFVTPQLFDNADEWVIEKKAEGFWKDVKVINSEKLEEWLETAPSVGAWLAKHTHAFPPDGLQATDDFWEEWSKNENSELNEDVVLAGRLNQQQELFSAITPGSIVAVEALSRDEALAFIVASFKADPTKSEHFFANSLIVENSHTYRLLAQHYNPLILIPKFDDQGEINRAVSNGHTVLVPVGIDNAANWKSKIVLPKLDRDAFVAGLIKSGMTREFSEKISKESGRNILILRRQLQFVRAQPHWANPENVRDIIPALLVGRWDENFEQDREIISILSGIPYNDFVKKINRWLNVPDSPLVKIGSMWRLTSPFDAWTNASIHLTRPDFELLKEISIKINGEINPAFELQPDVRIMAPALGKSRKFSKYIVEGVLQSLILTSIFGESLKFDLPINADQWVDQIVAEILNSENVDQWKSFEHYFPLFAEASPIAFLGIIESKLGLNHQTVIGLFDEEPGFIFPTSYLSSLLWALEGLAWYPEYLTRVSMILAHLSMIDPGVSTSNRPIASLKNIFKSWRYQTTVNFDDRMAALQAMSAKFPEIGWKIYRDLLPKPLGDSLFPNAKQRWRMFQLETEIYVTVNELLQTHEVAISSLLSLYDKTEEKMAELIDISDKLSRNHMLKILKVIETDLEEIDHSKKLVWRSLLKTLSWHRSFPDNKRKLDETDLEIYERLYKKVAPQTATDIFNWLFSDSWPEFPIGFRRENFEKRSEYLEEQRKNALIAVYNEGGVDMIVKLHASVKMQHQVGSTLASLDLKPEEISELWKFLKDEDERFLAGFISRISYLRGNQYIFDEYIILRGLSYSTDTLVKLLLPLRQGEDVWDFVEKLDETGQSLYWSLVDPHLYGVEDEKIERGFRMLLKHSRFVTALNEAAHFVSKLSTALLVEILESVGTKESKEIARLDGYSVVNLFEQLEKTEEVDHSKMIDLEWLFLPVFSSYGTERAPIKLHQELSNNPQFFLSVLNLLYKSVPENEPNLDSDWGGNEKFGYDLLEKWHRLPGSSSEGIDNEALENWITEVRNGANDSGILEIADMYIGKLFAHATKDDDGFWPPRKVCEIIEYCQSESINETFSTENFNIRGFSSRGAFDGGDIERDKATFYRELARQHRINYPTLAKIFDNLARGYESDARRMDERAERSSSEY